MPHQPKKEVLRELHTVLERLQFIPEIKPLLQDGDQQQVQSTLSFLFQQDVSADMLLYLAELHHAGLSHVLLDDVGQEFFRQCQQYYEGLAEIRIITAVEMSPVFKRQLAIEILQQRTDSGRVVFEVLPSLIGGCLIIDADGTTVDFSFKTNIAFYARQFFERKFQEIQS